LTGDIINEMSRLYSYEPLAELYFSEVEVVKHGSYIDFNLTVKNQGIVNTPNVTLVLYSDGEEVKTFDVGDTEYGGGRVLRTKNVKLPDNDATEITFVIDPQNNIEEYDKENNKITLQVREDGI
jgi:hypothetical protein